MNKEIFIKKRSGSLEKFSADKINKVLQWATEGIKNVSFEEVAMNAHLSFFDGMSSGAIHAMLIEAAANLITVEKPNYQFVASRLLNYQLRKKVWGGKNPPKLHDLVKTNIDKLVYDDAILEWYSKKDFDKLDEYEVFNKSIQKLKQSQNSIIDIWINKLNETERQILNNILTIRRIEVINNQESYNIPRKILKIKKQNINNN
jgi:hypothetical protein